MPDFSPDALAVLRCPSCGGELAPADGGVTCTAGHHHDRARQGYLSLRVAAKGMGAPVTGDTAEMVEARERFQRAGHHDALAAALRDAIADALGEDARGWFVDLAGGPGWHANHVLDVHPGMHGVVLDASTAAVRRAVRAHPQVVAATADLRARIPIADGAATLVLKVFAPGPPAETERILAPGGVLVAVIPEPEHHRELVQSLKLLKVPAGKADELAASLGGLEEVARTSVHSTVEVDRAAAADAIFMGPNAFHQKREQVEAALAAGAETLALSIAVTVLTLRRPA